MRRVDRLFKIIQMLRRSRVVTAAQMADRLEVSVRTIYRDIEHLSVSGVPIMSEPGVGYRMRGGYDLPPLHLDADELSALLLGARMVAAWVDADLADAADRLVDKIETELTAPQRAVVTDHAIFALGHNVRDALKRRFAECRQSVEAGESIVIAYADEKGATTERTLRPLGLFFGRGRWMLGAWCELRQDFRVFRVDRITSLTSTGEFFDREATPDLDDFLAHQRDNADY